MSRCSTDFAADNLRELGYNIVPVTKKFTPMVALLFLCTILAFEASGGPYFHVQKGYKLESAGQLGVQELQNSLVVMTEGPLQSLSVQGPGAEHLCVKPVKIVKGPKQPARTKNISGYFTLAPCEGKRFSKRDNLYQLFFPVYCVETVDKYKWIHLFELVADQKRIQELSRKILQSDRKRVIKGASIHRWKARKSGKHNRKDFRVVTELRGFKNNKRVFFIGMESSFYKKYKNTQPIFSQGCVRFK